MRVATAQRSLAWLATRSFASGRSRVYGPPLQRATTRGTADMEHSWRRLSVGLLVSPILLGAALLHCGASDGAANGGAPDGGTTGEAAAGALADAGIQGDAAPETPPPTEGSGTRFRVTGANLAFDDGTTVRSVSADFLDTKLNTLCRIVEVASNHYVCLSNERVDIFDSPTFADPSCTTPVLAARASALEDAKFVRWGQPCSAKIGEIGPLTNNVQTYAKDPVTNECRTYAGSVSTMPIPTEIAFSEFGEFTRVVDTTPFPGERSGSRLALQPDRYVGPDGSFRAPGPRVVDLVRSAAGSVAFGTDKKPYLFTASGALRDPGLSFADTACVQPTLSIEKDYQVCHDDPYRPLDATTSVESSDGTCRVTKAFTRPSGPALAVLYESAGATCRAALRSSAVALDSYPAQALVEVPLASLVALSTTLVATNANVVSGTALEARATVYSSADGLEKRDRTAKLYLRKYDLACTLGALAGATTERCVPDVRYAELGPYVDAACTQGALLDYGSLECGPLVPYLKYFDGGLRIAKLLPGASVVNVYRKDMNGDCMPSTDLPASVHPLANTELLAPGELPALVSRKLFVD